MRYMFRIPVCISTLWECSSASCAHRFVAVLCGPWCELALPSGAGPPRRHCLTAMQGTSFNTEGSAGPVRAALDEANLLAYLQRTASAALPPSPRLSVRQFAHGQSNPTYLLTLTAGEGGQQAGGVSKLVLRKKPPGVILASAHAVEREYQVISALHAQRSVPVSGQLHNSPLCRGCHYENLTTGFPPVLLSFIGSASHRPMSR